MVKTYIWDVPSPCLVSYSGSPPAARAMGTKSTGGFNHPEGYPVSGIINNLGWYRDPLKNASQVV